ncbi:MAG: hypothetical protein HY698_07550 [Deltaproteobacteria bacterium]|nr:hypothetical protein [Deltaproteobacteria bacterium]
MGKAPRDQPVLLGARRTALDRVGRDGHQPGLVERLREPLLELLVEPRPVVLEIGPSEGGPATVGDDRPERGLGLEVLDTPGAGNAEASLGPIAHLGLGTCAHEVDCTAAASRTYRVVVAAGCQSALL